MAKVKAKKKAAARVSSDENRPATKVGKSGAAERESIDSELRVVKPAVVKPAVMKDGEVVKAEVVTKEAVLFPAHNHVFGRVIANMKDLPKRQICTFVDKDNPANGACGFEEALPWGSTAGTAGTAGTADPDDEELEDDEDGDAVEDES